MLAAGCAPAVGWQRSDARVCAEDSPPVVCVHAWPDQAVELELGDARLVPGECAVAPKGGSLEVRWTDADGRAHAERVRVPRRTRTELALGADGGLHVARRIDCDPAMPVFEP